MADAGACAGGDSTRRKMDAPADSTAEIVSEELYDLARAKIAANLRWICAKAYGIDNIPEELKDPFYIDQYEEEHIKPPVIKLLLSSELYCRVCSLILKGDQVASLKGHESVIQALFQKGIYVIESDDTPVVESDLIWTPIKMSPHMAMIDALMMAYTVEMISIEKVVASVKCFSTFSASNELPYDLEDAMIFWINKVNLKMREITEKEVKQKQHLLESPGHQKVRYRRDHLSNRQLPFFPLLEDLMNDCRDGAALLTVVHYYCPAHMKLEEICLKEVTSTADSIYNIRLLREFSNEYLSKCFYLTVEDMLFAPLVLKPNMMVFIAELFWWFENVKPDFVQPRDLQEVKDAKTMLQQKGSRLPVPISKATKRSFMVNPAASSSAVVQLPVQLPLETLNRYSLHPEEFEYLGKGNPAFSPSHPLLPLRQKQQKSLQGEDSSDQRHRSNSLTRVDGQPQDSILAWPETKQRPLSQPTPFALHYAASSDADPSSGDSISLARSISKDSLASNIVHITPKQQPQSAPVKSDGKSLLNNVEIEDEDEELIAVICPDATSNQGNLELQSVPARSSSLVASAWAQKSQTEASKSKTDSFFLEPLMPAVLRPTKEKQSINKEDECGEGKKRGFVSKRVNEGHTASVHKKASSNQADHSLRTFVATSSSELSATGSSMADRSVDSEARGEPFHPQAIGTLDTLSLEQSSAKADEDLACSTNIGSMKSPNSRISSTTWTVIREDTDSDILDMEEVEQDLVSDDHSIIAKYIGEEESAKLQEDMKVKEHEDKDDASGRSSPCLSTVSQISSSSVTSGSARMTNFAERKLQRLNNYETKSSTSSSQKTTPDGSECSSLLTTWKQKREQSPNRQINVNLLASELAQLHMQLEEKRRVIEAQKKKKEVLSARQRLKLGKAAFLGVVKKGKGPDVAQPLKPEHFTKEHSRHNERGMDEFALISESEVTHTNEEVFEDFLEMSSVKTQEPTAFFEQSSPKEPTTHETDKSKMISVSFLEDSFESIEGDLPIEKLNEMIRVLRQDIMKISQQQELLMKRPSVSSSGSVSQDQKIKTPVHFVQTLSPTHMSSLPKPPCLGQGGSPPLGRPSELKEGKERPQAMMRTSTLTPSTDTLPHLRQFPPNNSSKPPTEATVEDNFDPDSTREKQSFDWLCDERNQQAGLTLFTSKDTNILSKTLRDANSSIADISCSSGKENTPAEESMRIKGNLIEVDLSDLKAPDEEGEAESQGNPEYMMDEVDQKSGVSFFFKDGQKAEDELAKKRAAFLLKQQRKAEEIRIRKLQFEAEAEQKRDEARRKAEEDRIRKEEEKARRELIKQEHLRRKHQQNLEEQGRGKPKPKPKPKQPRPISVHREEPYSNLERKCSSIPDNLSSAQSGSSLSLASATTTEPESVKSGGAPSKRVKSMETLPTLSRNPSRNTERDWETTSATSSVASVAEYTGPKMFKEPCGKSNKSIIHNAISYCCLAGKVNESHKNSILEELNKCDAKHFIILFRDAGCQFRALYCSNPETEEICKLTGTGPKSITKKMIDKLYKYSSGRKQFNVIPSKTMSACVDALTIHNCLWQPKLPVVPKKTSTHK